MTVAGQAGFTYNYDNANRLTQISEGSAAVSFAYDSSNRRTSLTLPNGIVMSYGYDNASQLTGITYTNGSTTLGTLTYGYDLAGRRTQMGGSYAQIGFPLGVSEAEYNTNNQLSEWGTASLYYDASGNMTSDGVNSFSWNARNQMSSVNAGSVSFQYDPYGRRAAKTVAGITTNYLYDGANVAQEISGGSPTANLLSGGIDEVFTRTDSSGTANFLTDALGSTINLTNSSGSSLAQYTYEPFGNATLTSGSSTNPYEYAGRENDGTGLYYYRARYYSPTLQRFVSEDPLGLNGGINSYRYAYDSPPGFTDPSGLWPQGTVSIGGTININLGFTNITYSGGFVVDTHGNVGVYNTVGGGGAFSTSGLGAFPNQTSGYPFKNIAPTEGGMDASVGLSVGFSNAKNINDLAGPFVNGSVGGGEGVHGSVDGFAGPSPDGTVVGGGVTVGGGGGAGGGGSVGVTNTTITPLWGPGPGGSGTQGTAGRK